MQGDILPQNMCSACMSELIQTYIFQQKCQQTDTFLRSIICSDELKLLKDEHIINTQATSNIVPEFTVNCSNSESNKLIDPQPCEQVFQNNTESQVLIIDKEKSDNVVNELDVAKKTSEKLIKIIKKSRQVTKAKEPPYTIINKKLKSNDERKQHRKEAKHTEARNHACTVCLKMFTSTKLRQHMRTHTKEKPYRCKVCFQGFSMSGNLKRHMMTHTGERPHHCEVCGKGLYKITSIIYINLAMI